MRFFVLKNLFMEIKELYKIYTNNKIITTDSRNINEGCIFFALKGENFNGNKFAEDALNKGASYAIVDENEYASNSRCILVDDVLQTLQKLANYHRKQLKIPIIGVTGSNGKTTTKELIFCVLNSQYRTFATKGNFNNHIGVPLSLLSIDESYEMAIIEMGANHQGEIHELCMIAEPDFGLITNVGKAHLEGFGSFEGVIKTKTELYRFVNQKQGTLFINIENEILIKEADKLNCAKVYYGNSEHSNVGAEIIEVNPFLHLDIISSTKEKTLLKSQLAGAYNKENILAAASIGLYFNIPLNKISVALSDYRPENSRSQIVKTEKNILLCDYYNANPSSMEVALQNFHQANFEFNRKVVMLGGMKELGADSELEHNKLVDLAVKMKFDEIFLVGNEFVNTKIPNISFFPTSEALSKYLENYPITNSVVLIKGSRGSKMEVVVPNL